MKYNRDITIAIDFDDTLTLVHYAQFNEIIDSNDIGALIAATNHYAMDFIRELVANRFKVVIWTCRHNEADIERVKKFLAICDVKVDRINSNNPYVQKAFGDSRKIHFDMCIDNCNYGMPDDLNDSDFWRTVMDTIMFKFR